MIASEIQDKIISTIGKGNQRQIIRHFLLPLSRIDDEVILEAMMEFFFDGSEYDLQLIAGGFLWKLKPKYNRDLYEDIRKSLTNWDFSVEELPWYFVTICGFSRVNDVLDRLEIINMSEREERALNTYRYWLKSKKSLDYLNSTWESYFKF